MNSPVVEKNKIVNGESIKDYASVTYRHSFVFTNGNYTEVMPDQIEIYAESHQITRLAILFDLAGWIMVDRQPAKLRPSMHSAMFRKL